MSKYELPLRYLQYRRLVKLARVGEDTMDVAVTFGPARTAPCGCILPWDALEVWYQEHKDGFLGIVTTIAVSLVTARWRPSSSRSACMAPRPSCRASSRRTDSKAQPVP